MSQPCSDISQYQNPYNLHDNRIYHEILKRSNQTEIWKGSIEVRSNIRRRSERIQKFNYNQRARQF